MGGRLGCFLVMHILTMIRTAQSSRMEELLSRLFKNLSGCLVKFDALLIIFLHILQYYFMFQHHGVLSIFNI